LPQGCIVKSGKLDRLVEEYYVALYRYAYRLTGSTSDADDLTQETYCKAQLKLDQLRDDGKAKAWLFSILRNVYLHRVRTERQQRFISLDAVIELAEPHAGPLPPVEPECLQHALQELPELYRTPLILYYFEDFSYRDISEQMELPLGTVMSRLARGKAFLRARLSPRDAPALAASPRRVADGL
jgi:RNA polymerase sigma-70 factor (ECF subfamily)